MGAPLDRNRKRGVAVLASGVVISLSALTAGVVPAVAQPDSDDVVTTVAPKPDVSEPKASEPKASEPKADATVERPASAPEPQAPATEAPEWTQAPATQAPATQAPVVEPEPAAQPEPEPVAPPKTSVAVQAPEPVAPTAEPSASAEPSATVAPSATVEPTPAASATPDDAEPATTPSAPATESNVRSTTASAPATGSTTPTPTSGEKPSDAPSDTAAAETTERSAEESDNPTVSIEHAAAEIQTLVPETLEAPAEDVQLARNAKPVFEPEPAPAPEQDIAAFKQSVDLTLGRNGNEAAAKVELEAKRDRDVQLVSNVRQWRPEWVEYDEYYRPVLMNPFRDPVRIVYVYDMRPRIVYIPPLSRMVLQAAQFAAYSFTAAVLSPVAIAANLAQAATNIAVGSFFGGGYFPGAGLPLPPPPPPVLRYDNVPVLVNYSNARYEPFRVRQIVDVGEDRVYGGHKVLLDGATPAWGEWTQNARGERQFEVHRTQQFPGLSEPAEGPLPGDYRLRLASDEVSAGGLTGRDIFLMVAAGVIGTLGFGAIGLAFFLGRRRPEY
ncbi:hypothetical protein DQP55_05570 [Mycolicibacterium sp. GF69]|uniref:hypothetical protein n=1 Tax=Mycolicibacterium sp. GF69 TaxID=2267251 RepID=UPI000DCF436E|nr:hypothetical protein [Mycolicibacterium sp. GF69]RAV16307.1 hypothetical protein DQP55_05570 [Mycolicibacterium sp. GF69]